jgi:hypothetical protein
MLLRIFSESFYYAPARSTPETNQQKAEDKALRIEANNPNESTQWQFLWEFDEDDRIKLKSWSMS